MKKYPSILGPSGYIDNRLCYAFEKHDGTCLRFEWSLKRGWWKFGTRYRLFDKNDPEFGPAIDIFLKRHAEGIERIICDDKDYRGVEHVVAFCEYFGPSSFGQWHDFTEKFDLVLFDIDLNKKGFVLPAKFVKNFIDKVPCSALVYQGPLNPEFVQRVVNNDLEHKLKEGVVAKGIVYGKKRHDQGGLWMCKIKTKWWLEELKKRWAEDLANKKETSARALEQILKQNEKEQQI